MFDWSPEDRLGVLVAAEANLRARREADVELLRLALVWADLHPDESLPAPVDDIEARRRRLADLVGVRMGGEGTPPVLAHCPAELGAVLETTHAGARHLIADALDLRDRLPRLWVTVQDGCVAAWKARRVAAATRTLTVAQAAEVDTVVHEVIATLGWSRFEAILDATIKQTDPDGARAAEQDAASQRFVAVGRANDHHIRTLIARGTSLDILSFMAAVNRIADLLGDEGDPDPIDIRRSKAIGVLARPAHALELLVRHQSEDSSEAADKNGEPDPEGDGYLSSPPDSSRREGHRCGCAPRIRLHVHLTDAALRGADSRAVCRIDGLGPVTAQTVRDWLGRSNASVTLQPVVLPICRPSTATRSRKQSATPWSPATPPASTPGRRVPNRPSTWTTRPPTFHSRRAVQQVRLVSARWVRWPEGSTGTRRSATSKSDSRSRASTSGAAGTAGSGWSPTPVPTLSAEAQVQTPFGKPPHRGPNRHPDRPRLVLEPARHSVTGST